VYVVYEHCLLVSTLITPLRNKDLPTHHGGQPPEQYCSHENRDTETSEDFAPAAFPT
jgi:hypothetical protein